MRKLSIYLLIVSVFFIQYCSSSKKTSSGEPTQTAAVSVSYMNQIQPTVMAYCSPCHIPPKGNKRALDTYDAVKNNIGDVVSRIKRNPGDIGFMPFKHEKLSDSVINLFVAWKDNGMKEK